MDLFLYNQDKAQAYGLNNEFFISPRIDNLECAYTSLQALINNYQNKTLSNETSCHVFAAFNHEEVGSSSNHGAASTFLIDTLTRILDNKNVHEVLASSIMLSKFSHLEAITGNPAAYASIIVPGTPSVQYRVGNSKAK